MPRIDVPELEDSPRCPAFIRDALTAYLRIITDLARVFDGAGPVLRRLLDLCVVQQEHAIVAQLEKSGGAPANAAAAAAVVVAAAPGGPSRGGDAEAGAETPGGGAARRRVLIDLCSGGGGALVGLVARGALGPVDHVLLTDLYPNAAAFAAAERRLPPGVCRGVLSPVDASNVPPGLGDGGVRTMFNSLHHLPPQLAARVLADAARRRQPFAAFEVVERHPLTVLAAVVQGVLVPFLLPFSVRPPRVGRQLARVVAALPAAPFVVAWDGFASCMRAYSVGELRAMAAEASTADYRFVFGQAPRRWLGMWPFRLTWIEGAPVGAPARVEAVAGGGGH